ncbi:hypothetical protein L21_0417 [Methanoculleus chikugoensis]|uniref:P/Homo B domain-containing protein n=1 Tax=Methanoculleus chikugoensis TaxID=118126 RepID=A0A1M4MI87_9EURY|nr:hypothetical protein [Methanoculleus chikugoensis]NMA23945.1 hypothetical protein [Spirochaetales bacterium]SCL74538.1 hypothetical protein L21_0417 [Methanoculleus chikugoensis]
MNVTKCSAQVGERIVVALLAGLLLVSGAAALPCTPAAGIAVVPADDLSDRVELLRSVGGTIHPGEYQTIWKSVPSGVRTLQVYLDWSGHQHSGTDSLTLTITPPGSGVLGPYRDGVDRRMDEKISLALSGSDSLPSGMWKFLIFGEDVPEEGTDYTLNVGY